MQGKNALLLRDILSIMENGTDLILTDSLEASVLWQGMWRGSESKDSQQGNIAEFMDRRVISMITHDLEEGLELVLDDTAEEAYNE